MITKIVILIFVSVSVIWLAKAAAEGGGTLSQGTNGTREVLIPDPQSSTIPSDLLTTHSSVTGDSAPLDVVDSSVTGDSTPLDVVDDDGCVHEATAAWICGTEGREEEDDKKEFTLENTLVGLTFEVAVFLMVSRFQPRGNTSLLASLSPFWSPSWPMSPLPPPPPPPPPPSSLSSSSASFPLFMAHVAILFGLTVRLIGRMMLRRGHTGAAIACTYACILAVAVAFFSMTYVFVDDSFAWVVWAAGGILLLVMAYTIAQR
ncbi:hypothetical protein RHSIM_RhsimUnG0222500 [Rhododendron simsii]|uniref:Uncharacterized protein n=1 Tax=Rhododendron simsii TaxID=118357 RepID=A0A834FVI2_RHOSS|nr:hypothetical protein RHSIM_RhsimUnG0222500 [Rhododendron simsii]